MNKLFATLCCSALAVCSAAALDWNTDANWNNYLTAFEQFPVQKLTPVIPNYKHISYAPDSKAVYDSEEQALRDRFLPVSGEKIEPSSAEFVMDLSSGIFFAFRFTGTPGSVSILMEREIPGCTLNIRFSEANAAAPGAVRKAVSTDDKYSYAAFFIPWNSFYSSTGTYPLFPKNDTKWKITVTRSVKNQCDAVCLSDVVVKPVPDRKMIEAEINAFEAIVKKNIGEENMLGSLDGIRPRIENMKYWHEVFHVPIRVSFALSISRRAITPDMIEDYKKSTTRLVQNMREAQNDTILFRYYYGYPFEVVRSNWTFLQYTKEYEAIRNRVFSDQFGVEIVPEVETQAERNKAIENTRTDSVW